MTQIRQLNETAPKQQLHLKRTELTDAQCKIKEYREALVDANEELKSWARQNYALSHKVQEMEELVRMRDKVIEQLQLQVNAKPKVIELRK